MLAERVYEDINLKYSREFIQLATNIIVSFYEYRDIIFFTTDQSKELFKILKKIMELQIITNEIKEFADDENYYIESYNVS